MNKNVKIVFSILTLLFAFFKTCRADMPKQKCTINDNECQKQYFQYVGKTNAPTGIPAIGVPIVDPLKLTNARINFMGYNVTLVDGECVGIGKCTVLNYRTDILNFYKTSEMICNKIIIKGRYTAIPNGKPQFLSGAYADGYITLTLDDWYFKFKYPFEILKHDNEEIYLKGNFNESQYVSEIHGGVNVEADGIKMNGRDISNVVTNYFNNNWRSFTAYDQSFHDLSVKYYYDIYGLFFDGIPAKTYISDDLSQFVKNYWFKAPIITPSNSG